MWWLDEGEGSAEQRFFAFHLCAKRPDTRRACLKLLPLPRALAVAQVGWLQMLKVAKNMPDGTWWHAAKTTLANHGFVCPSLIESEIAPPEILEVARHDKAVRRNVLRRYKLTVVQPRALARDDREFDMAAQKDLVGFQLAVQHVFPNRVCLAWEGADAHLAASDWECLRWWAVVRMTACWPCQMCGGTSSMDLLDECPLCGEVQVDVAHCLHVCPGTESLFNSCLGSFMSRQIDAQIFFAVLFHTSVGPALDLARAKYVAAAVRRALSLAETA
ncbi:hypothetical protein AK812_SmicGene15077 [Symbiodinium microadriaticum]|uniref:Uncharacterized protein n=1 Tax=Symbiodinium microadriaticum TaxID=2951 RepID=A0A1Q9E424_SYMMI|nr:hypothetical protein AK812_SmicGene15077 [Symbiodinium microadriaticum]